MGPFNQLIFGKTLSTIIVCTDSCNSWKKLESSRLIVASKKTLKIVTSNYSILRPGLLPSEMTQNSVFPPWSNHQIQRYCLVNTYYSFLIIPLSRFTFAKVLSTNSELVSCRPIDAVNWEMGLEKLATILDHIKEHSIWDDLAVTGNISAQQFRLYDPSRNIFYLHPWRGSN